MLHTLSSLPLATIGLLVLVLYSAVGLGGALVAQQAYPPLPGTARRTQLLEFLMFLVLWPGVLYWIRRQHQRRERERRVYQALTELAALLSGPRGHDQVSITELR